MTVIASGVSDASGQSRLPSDAKAFAHELGTVMDTLVATVEEETRLVRAGRLPEATRLQDVKRDLTHRYVLAVAHWRANRDVLTKAAPEAIAGLQRRHDLFRALLQINLTVLATAHAVSEGIIRGVCSELQRKASPQTYGASGRASAPARHGIEPFAVSRAL